MYIIFVYDALKKYQIDIKIRLCGNVAEVRNKISINFIKLRPVDAYIIQWNWSSCSSLASVWHQAFIWNNGGLLSFRTLGTKFRESESK